MLIDMPVSELETYQGRNPRPADYDAYWEKALAEMRAVKPDVELVPFDMKAPYADCFDMYFTGTGGARIHAKLMKPEHAVKPGPAVVFFHGYWSNSGDWVDKLGYVAAGFTVAALDVRGQGGLSEDNGGHIGNTIGGHIIRGLDNPAPDKLLFRQIFLDCAQLTYLVMDMPEVDPARVGAHGGSQGGGLTLACAGLVPELNRAAPVFPFLSDYKRVWEMDLAKDAYAELKEYFRRFDPQHKREEEIFTKLGYIDVQNMAARITKTDILFFTGLMDTICPPSTQYAAYNKITAKKEHILFPDYGHEYIPDVNDMVFRYMMEML